MNLKISFLLCFFLLFCGCTYQALEEEIIDNDSTTLYRPSSFLYPKTVLRGYPFPVIVKGDSSEVREELIFKDVKVLLNRGLGAVVVTSGDSIIQDCTVGDSLFALSTSVIPIKGGKWPDTLTVLKRGVYHVTDNVEIPVGMNVTIAEGVTIYIDSLLNIRNYGTFSINGSSSLPITLTSASLENPWGGIISDGELAMTHVIISNGGGNTSDEFVVGHSNSQGVIHTTNGGSTSIKNSFVVHNYGKGGTSRGGNVIIDSTFFSFCDMGGEYEHSNVEIRNSHFQFIPNSDTINYIDDDNDCLYFLGIKGEESDSVYSIVADSYLGYGRDDAIDHNGAFLLIQNVEIDFFENEGVACSSKRVARIDNSRITRCEQAVEAGYGSPHVYVNHSEFLFNDIGIRFGDWYDWGCTGYIEVTNSISIHNNKNYFNLDKKTGSEIDSLMKINYSIIDADTIYNGFNNYLSSLLTAGFTSKIEFDTTVYESSDSFKIGRYY